MADVQVKCFTEKAPNTWHRQGTQKTGNTYNQYNRLPVGTIVNSQTKHQAPSKGQTKGRITPTSTAAMHSSIPATSCHSHAHPAGSSPDPLGRRSPMRSTGGLSHTTTQTPPAPAGTCCAPASGARYMQELVDRQERTASRWGGEGENGGRGGVKEEGAGRRRGSGAIHLSSDTPHSSRHSFPTNTQRTTHNAQAQ